MMRESKLGDVGIGYAITNVVEDYGEDTTLKLFKNCVQLLNTCKQSTQDRQLRMKMETLFLLEIEKLISV